MNDFQYELFNIINIKRHDFMNLFGSTPRYLLVPLHFTSMLYPTAYLVCIEGQEEPKFMGMRVIESPACVSIHEIEVF